MKESPNQPSPHVRRDRSRTDTFVITAGRELHPTPKNLLLFVFGIIILFRAEIKGFSGFVFQHAF